MKAEAARKLAGTAGLDFDGLVGKAQAKDFSPIDLPLRLQAHVASEVRAVEARNVLAALPGRGGRSQEAVVYTARYAHLRSGAASEPVGLDDDRTGDTPGTATLLEAARLWSQQSAVRTRTILFAALAAESHGLPAADHFVASEGAVPPGRISLALNFEPQALDGDVGTLAVRGAARTNFAPALAATAKALRLTVHSDPYVASARDYDSAAYRLALAGIPSLSLADAPRDRSTFSRRVAGDASLARLGYELGVRASAQSDLVGWLPDDEFEAARRRSQLAPHNKPLERKPKRVK
jgi:Zn-dependent M28 family amino/carboxypeptidase